MENHITSEKLDSLMDQFLKEHPYGDSRELAAFMYNHGWECGMSTSCGMI